MSSDQGVTIRGADGKLYFVASVTSEAECIPQPEAREEPAPRAQGLVSGVSRHFVPVALCLIADPREGETPERVETCADVAFMPVALCIVADNNDGGGGETATEATASRARAA